MKIGIDIDNTITDTMPILIDYCKRYNDNVVKRNLKMNDEGFNTSSLFNWTNEEEIEFCNKYLEEILLKATLKPQAQKVIQKLKEDGIYIYIVTARKEPYINNPYIVSKEFLDQNNIVYNEIIVGCEDKCSFCLENNIDIMIDDEPNNINTISKYIPVIVFEDKHNIKCNGENIVKVKEWQEVYKILKGLIKL